MERDKAERRKPTGDPSSPLLRATQREETGPDQGTARREPPTPEQIHALAGAAKPAELYVSHVTMAELLLLSPWTTLRKSPAGFESPYLRELWTPEFHRAYVQEFERNGRGHERLAKLFLDGDRIKIEAQHHLPPELTPYYRRIRQVHPERGVRYSGHAFPEYVARTLVAPELWPKGARAELAPLGAAMPGVGGSDSGSAGDRWIRPPRPGAAMQPDPEPSPRRGWLYYLYPQMLLFERGRDIMRDKREK